MLPYLPAEWPEQDGRLLGCKRTLQCDKSGRRGSRNKEEADDASRNADFVFVGHGVGSGLATTVAGKPTDPPPKSIFRRGPTRSDVRVSSLDERRRRGAEVRMRLQSIHPNPGPRNRQRRTEEAKKVRREKRKARRKENSRKTRERKEQERSG